ncbi:hypothetical protein [Promicromonospora sp. NPDC060271]|uniref:hypothetical protein n=1 Tax=Promicromonospora sp. NPDC060271 TaxID=3347089 RepID=UPI0036614D97
MANTGPDDQSGNDAAPPVGRNWGAGVALGLSIGLALGLALDNLAVGLALGVAFFPVFAMVRATPAAEDDAPGEGKRPAGDA